MTDQRVAIASSKIAFPKRQDCRYDKRAVGCRMEDQSFLDNIYVQIFLAIGSIAATIQTLVAAYKWARSEYREWTEKTEPRRAQNRVKEQILNFYTAQDYLHNTSIFIADIIENFIWIVFISVAAYGVLSNVKVLVDSGASDLVVIFMRYMGFGAAAQVGISISSLRLKVRRVKLFPVWARTVIEKIKKDALVMTMAPELIPIRDFAIKELNEVENFETGYRWGTPLMFLLYAASNEIEKAEEKAALLRKLQDAQQSAAKGNKYYPE